MKLFSIVVSIFIFASSAAAYPMNMKALFTFEEGAYELISGDIGAVYGATLTEDRFGRANSAYAFDGDDWIQFSHRDEYNYNPTSDFTISVWVKAAESQKDLEQVDNDIIGKWTGHATGTDVGYPYTIRYLNRPSELGDTGNVLGARFDPVLRRGPSVRSIISINDGEFHNITFAKEANLMSLYVDSILQGQNTDTTTLSTNNLCDLYFARRGQSAPFDVFFTGVIDDFLIYDYALSEAQIYDIYRAVPSPEPSSLLLLASGLFALVIITKGRKGIGFTHSSI